MTRHYLIRPLFARKTNIPTSFVGIVLQETKRAVYIYGYGKMDPEGSCCVCGRKLTHPGSILVGIGPECLGNWGARDIKLEHLTEDDKKQLESLIRSKKVDQWIPKSIIKQITETREIIVPPENHKMFPTINSIVQKVEELVNKAALQAKIWKGVIAIKFPYDIDTLRRIKSIDKRVYHGDDKIKYWTCPISVKNIVQLRQWGFSTDLTDLFQFVKEEDYLEQIERMLEGLPAKELVLPEIDFKKIGLKRELFPFQEQGVRFLEAKDGRALVGDEMGLGKTIQALAYLQLHPELRPAIIVCPASLKLNWAKEIRLTLSSKKGVAILEGKKDIPTGWLKSVNRDIIIVNYDILIGWLKEIRSINPKIVIADEAHYFKANSAKRTKAMKDLIKVVSHFIALSGTPIMSRPMEIYNAWVMIDPVNCPNFYEFAQKYCGAKHNGFGWEYVGASNTEELHKLLTSTVMIRRKKTDVLKDLPDKIYSSIPMKLDNQKEYNLADSDFIGYVKKTKGKEAAERASNAEVIAQIEALKQIAVRGKLNAVIEWVHDFLESGEKLVLFGVHKFVIDKLINEFRGVAVKIDGSTSNIDKQKAVEAFQQDDNVRLLIGNIKAAGIGHTLTAASNVAFIEYPWTPGEMKQAEDRCHRIGQKNCVNIHLLVAYHTIEGEIVELLDSKTQILDAVLDGEVTEMESLLSSIIKLTLKK